MSFAPPGSRASADAAEIVDSAVSAAAYRSGGGGGGWVAPMLLAMEVDAHDGRACTAVVLGQRGCSYSMGAAEYCRRIGGGVVAWVPAGDHAARLRARLRVPTLPAVFIRKGPGCPWVFVGGWTDWLALINRR